ncbi:alkaline phosphatase family protein [Persicimonas caeni]|uniref:Alkaline phosphatase family protein n=1 Tax=Persicimonas caeni TaxID=2292766 RepID=A0A4Y6PZC4_PERCE|nr:alkaline phosphatase family protein [Persicimonas caeni]QDG53674.1 alkaline phosphatase family protein [Persicimonas caeni]QED34895.1 alkaline phosphatase family protein [Persicimonas caeni]
MSSTRGDVMDARNLLISTALALAVGTVGVSCSFLATPISEQIEYVIEGEQVELRDPMRPARGAPRVLVFALDSVGRDAFRRGVDSGELAQVARLLGERRAHDTYEHAYMARDALTTLPSVTIPAWTSVYTGRPPADTGIPGNEWYDRQTSSFFAPAPTTVGDHDHIIRILTDNFLNNQLEVPTLFELAKVRSFVAMAPVYEGADLFTKPDLDEILPVLGGIAEGVVGPNSVDREIYAELDEEAADGAVDAIEEHGVADLQVLYLPGIDLYTHVAKRPKQSQRRYMREVIDPLIGEVLDAYRERGALDDTYVLFISDHGFTPTKNDDRHALEWDGRDEPPQVLRHAGFRVRRDKLEVDDDERDYSAVVAYQGAMSYIYLADRSTCARRGSRCDWTKPPRFDEDVLEVVRAFHANNALGWPVRELQGTLDLILARRPVPAGQDAGPFEVWDGQKLVPIDRYVAEHGRDDLLDFDRRMRQLAAGPYGHRVGDVVLLSKAGMGRRIDDRYYFSEPYRSWHGSAHEADSLVTFTLAHPTRSGDELRELVRGVAGDGLDVLDVTPLVLTLLEKDGDLSHD